MLRGTNVSVKRKATAVLLVSLWLITMLSGAFPAWAETEEPGEGYEQELAFDPGEEDELVDDDPLTGQPGDEEELITEPSLEGTDFFSADVSEDGNFELFFEVEDEVLFPGMPDDYTLSADEIDNKRALVSEGVVSGFNDSVPGVDFVEGEVVFLTDSKQHAGEVAEAYGGELESFDCGIAVIELPEYATAFDAVLCAADTSNNLPAVYPNFIYTLPETFSEEIRPVNDGDMGMFAADAPVKQTWKSSFSDPFLKNPDAGVDNYQWHHDVIGSYAAWETTTGVGITVAVLDTGIQSNHPDLEPVPAGHNGFDGSTNTNDGNSHGTHVAGIIGARVNSLGGRGVAPGVSLLPVKVLGDDGNAAGTGTTSSIYRGIEYVVNGNGPRLADIINMSLGGYSDDVPYKKSVTDAINKGIVVVATAGNDSTNIRKTPATLPGVICVASTDMNGMRSNFSNYGPWVTISAPGSSILSTIPGSGYSVKGGTSMAAPIVSGCAALYISTLSSKPANAADVAKVKDALVKYAVKANSPQIGKIVNIGNMFDTVLTTPEFIVKRGAATVTDIKSPIPSNCDVTISGKNFIVYTTDGTTPTVKDGIVTNGFGLDLDSYAISLSLFPAGKITIKALCVNAQGKVGKTATLTVTTVPASGGYNGMSDITGPTLVASGKQAKYQALVTGAAPAGTNKTVVWSVSDNSKAIISSDGTLTVKPGAAGSVKIFALSKNNEAVQASITVTINSSVLTSMLLFAPLTKLAVGGTADYPASYLLNQWGDFSDGTDLSNLTGYVKWSSSNPKAVTVNESGVVTAVGSGTATITMTSTDGSNLSKKVNVTSILPVTNVYISGSPAQLASGKSATIKATTYPAKPTTGGVIWTVDNASASKGIKITTGGKLSIPKNVTTGIVTVYATAKDGCGAVTNVSVSIVDKAASSVKITTSDNSSRADDKSNVKTVQLFTLNPPSVTDYDKAAGGAGATRDAVNETFIQLTGSAEGHAVSWSSGNQKVAMVDSTGRVTAIGPGKAVITCTASDGGGKKATCTVNVVIPASSVWVQGNRPLTSFNTPTLAFGKSLQMNASPLAAYGKVTNTKVVWTYTLRKSDGTESPAGSSALTGKIKLSSSGKLTLDKSLINNWQSVMGDTAYIRVTATAVDGSGVSGYRDVYPCRGTDAMKITQTKNVSGYFDIYYEEMIDSKNKLYGNYYKDYIVTTSNSKVLTIYGYGGTAYPKFVRTIPLAKGTAVIKITSNDGTGKSVSFRVRVI